ncbi:McrC family protein [Embleya sp. NPDC008237]|uniref:McrC family protein n=1 Tax=Embleya sp. NPDC008237 TaxID=3363978 RepID=UPI0036E5DBA9
MGKALDEVRIGEYTSADLDYGALSRVDLVLLRALTEQNRLHVHPLRTGWRIQNRSTVGVLVLERIRLVLVPKIAFGEDRLIEWLAYAVDTAVPHPPTPRAWQIGPLGVPDLVAAALVAECRKLLRRGLRRDYVACDSVTPVLRGRLDIAAQVGRRYGQIDRLHVRTFERDSATWENQVCASALAQAVRFAEDPAVVLDAVETLREFPAPLPAGEAIRVLRRARHNRLDMHYRSAHAWARAILDGGGITDLFTDAGLPAGSLLLNMNTLWERVVRRLADTAAGGLTVPAANEVVRVVGDLRTRPPFPPDALVALPGLRGWLPVDAKYKAYATKSVAADDVHQLLTYAAGYGDPAQAHAVIVHPAPNGATSRTLRVIGPRGRLGTIDLVGIHTGEPPSDVAVAQMAACFTRIGMQGTA